MVFGAVWRSQWTWPWISAGIPLGGWIGEQNTLGFETLEGQLFSWKSCQISSLPVAFCWLCDRCPFFQTLVASCCCVVFLSLFAFFASAVGDSPRPAINVQM